MTFWRLWVGPISDYRRAREVVIAAGFAVPTMVLLSLVLVDVEAILWSVGPSNWTYAARGLAVTAVILIGVSMLSAWLVRLMSRIAAIVILAIAVTVAVPLDNFFGRWTILLLRMLFDNNIDRMWVLGVIQDGAGLVLALGWSATAFLSGRAVAATFAARKLRLLTQSRPEEAFD